MNKIHALLVLAALLSMPVFAEDAPVAIPPAEPAVTLALSTKDGKLMVCKQSPWSKQQCVKFKKSPPAEAASIFKWLHRDDKK